MTAKADTEAKGGGSSAGGGDAESPPAQGGKKKKAAAKVTAVFLKRHTIAAADQPGGCHTYLPERTERYRDQPGGRLKTRVIPADTGRFDKATLDGLKKRGIAVSEAEYAKLKQAEADKAAKAAAKSGGDA